MSGMVVAMEQQPETGFIGAGNMARSLIGGLIADGWDPARIQVADPGSEPLQLIRQLGVTNTGNDNSAVAAGCEVVLLAVKPQVMPAVAREISTAVQQHQPLIISIAAGIREADLRRWLGDRTAIVRCMPNTPALVLSGATALYANPRTSEQQRDLAESLLRAVGLTLWVDNEELMDAVTALSGSGPAYIFLVIEALQAAGNELGLSADQARLLAIQTTFGAAKMALESQDEPAVLRQCVTSPGGTTEQALKVLEAGKLRGLFLEALKSARDRSKQLAEQFGAE